MLLNFIVALPHLHPQKKGRNLYQIKIPTCVDYYVFRLVSSACTEKGQKGVENQNGIHWNNNNLKSLSPKPSSILLQSLELFSLSLLIHPWVLKKKVQVIWEKVDVFLFYLYWEHHINPTILLFCNEIGSILSSPLLNTVCELKVQTRSYYYYYYLFKLLSWSFLFLPFFFFAFFNSLSKKMNKKKKTKTRY